MSQSLRPPWLETSEAVEKILQDENLTISITSLRNSRNDCPLVQQLLTTFTSKCLNTPSEWEQDIAKTHLALDVQNILSKWIESGRQATMEGSPLAAMLEPKSPTRTVDLNTGVSVPQKRRSPDASSDDEGDDDEPEAKQQRYSPVTGEKDFRCPYYILNQNDPAHQECKNKRFPNPRKLKEHIWRFTKPFKCYCCLEGFGREKTKAIHCNERKVKCVPVSINRYTGSLEQQRDEKINQARNTAEMINIFREYESRKKAQAVEPQPQPQHTTTNSNNTNNTHNTITINPSYAVTLPPSDCQWSPATEPPHSPWRTSPLHLYPATPSSTPPFDPNPRSRSNSNPNITYAPNPTHHPPFPIRTLPARPLPEIPQIIVTGLPTTATDDLSDLFSPHAHTAIHSQPGTPMQPSFNHNIFDDHHHHHHHHHQTMLQGHVDAHQAHQQRQREMEMERVMSQEMERVVSQHRELERVLSEQGAREQQEQGMQVEEDGGVDDDGVTRTVFTPGYGSFPPMRLRLRDNGVGEGLGQ
ncbi:hypothetical protein EX30DRAFT_396619 [Ascodesmis nigricans]|uniref:Uncharacterized protein n=1 Tax=Ascodesmis nigricans TaxID=341454 RepID=A0A4S2MU80_9PEZI|nr:hypothetical protein EX30DRAFT_396619 [Ascodesmis nigricans]